MGKIVKICDDFICATANVDDKRKSFVQLIFMEIFFEIKLLKTEFRSVSAMAYP